MLSIIFLIFVPVCKKHIIADRDSKNNIVGYLTPDCTSAFVRQNNEWIKAKILEPVVKFNTISGIFSRDSLKIVRNNKTDKKNKDKRHINHGIICSTMTKT